MKKIKMYLKSVCPEAIWRIFRKINQLRRSVFFPVYVVVEPLIVRCFFLMRPGLKRYFYICTYLDMFDYCLCNNKIIRRFSETESVKIIKPASDSIEFEQRHSDSITFDTNGIFVAGLSNTSVLADYDAVIHDDILLHDISSRGVQFLKKYRHRCFLAISDLGCVIKKQKTIHIPRGIKLTKLWSTNYFHFTIETISRLKYIDCFEEYREYPLLIDKISDPKNKYLLEIVNVYKHPIIEMEIQDIFIVDELVYVSSTSWVVPDGYDRSLYPVLYCKDAIFYIRELLLSKISNDKVFSQNANKVYLARGNNRRLVNEDEVVDYLKNQGFLIINPDKMDLLEEIACFANASVIVSVLGAALTNIIYCREDVKIYEICPLRYQNTSYSGIADVCNLQLKRIDAHLIKGGATLNSATFKVETEKLKWIISDIKR